MEEVDWKLVGPQRAYHIDNLRIQRVLHRAEEDTSSQPRPHSGAIDEPGDSEVLCIPFVHLSSTYPAPAMQGQHQRTLFPDKIAKCPSLQGVNYNGLLDTVQL